MPCPRWVLLSALVLTTLSHGQTPSPSAAPAKRTLPANVTLDPGSVTNGVYRNKSLGLTCKIPDGWVVRTNEMNARENEMSAKEKDESGTTSDTASSDAGNPASSAGAKVLLAAFSRPPEAKGGEVNASILIAAENAAAYPGLKEAAQYFYPLTEVARAQGFEPDEDPYAVEIDTKTLVRGDFHKDVGSRVMHQSTLALLSRGYAVSITVIGGSDDEVEELIGGLTFAPPAK